MLINSFVIFLSLHEPFEVSSYKITSGQRPLRETWETISKDHPRGWPSARTSSTSNWNQGQPTEILYLMAMTVDQ